MSGWDEFQGINAGYVAELYERYRQDPSSVDAESRALFSRWRPPEPAPSVEAAPPEVRAIVGAVNLAESIRR